MVLRGLKEPTLKRTVEGDLGLRVSAEALFLTARGWLEATCTRDGRDFTGLEAWVERLIGKPELLPENETEEDYDSLLAAACSLFSAYRHAGYFQESWTPAGKIFLQSGKDLRHYNRVIGTGGYLSRAASPRSLVDAFSAAFSKAPSSGEGDGRIPLLPRKFRYFRDATYLFPLLGNLAGDWPEAAASAALEGLTEIETREPSSRPKDGKGMKNRTIPRMTMGEYLALREEVLASWPTGKDVVSLKDAFAYQRAIPEAKRFARAMREAKDKKRLLLQPRAGVALIDEHVKLLRYLETVGEADLLPTTYRRYTRQNRYQEAALGIEKSVNAGTSLLNGFPAVNHGLAGCRQVTEAVTKPIQVRHGTPDARLLAEITLAAGFTSFEGGGISYNIPYAKKVPLEKSIRDWMYVDALVGIYEEEGLSVNREPFGPLTGTPGASLHRARGRGPRGAFRLEPGRPVPYPRLRPGREPRPGYGLHTVPEGTCRRVLPR